MEDKKYYIASKGMIYKRNIDNVIVGKMIYIDTTNDNIDNYIEVIDENNYNIQEKINKIKLERDIERNKILSKLKDEVEKKKVELFNEMKYENTTVGNIE